VSLKNGDKLECTNYRGIALLCTAYKVFANILRNRLKPITELIIGEYQAGFRPGRSTIDQLLTVKQILEKFWEYNLSV
jgi:sorting nexin-29